MPRKATRKKIVKKEGEFTHKCIKPSCPNTYNDNDPDPYYCPTCQEANKALAETIAKKIKPSSRPVKSGLQEYDEAPKYKGFMIVKL